MAFSLVSVRFWAMLAHTPLLLVRVRVSLAPAHTHPLIGARSASTRYVLAYALVHLGPPGCTSVRIMRVFAPPPEEGCTREPQSARERNAFWTTT